VLAISTGARYSEILTLPFRQLDFERNLIILKDTKNGEDRSIPLSPFAMEVLREYLKELAKRYPSLDPETCLLFPSGTIQISGQHVKREESRM